jgi:hypothetical protein
MKFTTPAHVAELFTSGERAMLGKCANPACDIPFRYLRGGRLFLIDLADSRAEEHVDGFDSHQPHRTTYFWLCDDCSTTMSVAMNREGAAVIQPITSLKAVPTAK